MRELSIGIKMVNFIEKMDLLLFMLMVSIFGIKKIKYTEMLALLLFGLMVLRDGLKMVKNMSLQLMN